jgi:TetR/AcrR family transcriptional regulator
MPSARRRQTRALLPQDKHARRQTILRAAGRLLARDSATTFSVEQLARSAGVAKGTVYLYFRTREEVLLALHEQQSHELFDVLEQALGARRVTGARVVAAGLEHLRAHPHFYPLAASCRSMLDTNIGPEAALAFKLAIAQRLQPLGQRIEHHYPGLVRGDGAALLLNCYALIVGLWQQADPPLVLQGLLDRPELAVLRFDFEKQLKAALLDLWDSAARRGIRRES